MKVVFLDTNAYSAFKLGHEDIIAVIQHVQTIGLSPIVLGELLSGFEMGSKIIANRNELKQFLASSRVKIYPITFETSQFYCEIYACLKRKGKPIPTNDLWIAALAMEHGSPLCTFDKHFDNIDGLLIGNTVAQFL